MRSSLPEGANLVRLPPLRDRRLPHLLLLSLSGQHGEDHYIGSDVSNDRGEQPPPIAKLVLQAASWFSEERPLTTHCGHSNAVRLAAR